MHTSAVLLLLNLVLVLTFWYFSDISET